MAVAEGAEQRHREPVERVVAGERPSARNDGAQLSPGAVVGAELHFTVVSVDELAHITLQKWFQYVATTDSKATGYLEYSADDQGTVDADQPTLPGTEGVKRGRKGKAAEAGGEVENEVRAGMGR